MKGISMNKNMQRLRRAKKTRSRIKRSGMIRLTVHKTPRHIYAQLIDISGRVIVSASTLHKELRESIKFGGNIAAAAAIGKVIGERAVNAEVTKVAFDRSGFKYHGRIRALADAVRETGIEF